MQKNKDLIKLTPKLKWFFQFNSNAQTPPPPPPLSGPLTKLPLLQVPLKSFPPHTIRSTPTPLNGYSSSNRSS